jgi:hypothetical protein
MGCQERGSFSGRAGDREVAHSESFTTGGATIEVDFAPGSLDLETAAVMGWVENAARAVTVYYGRFPVARAKVRVVPVPGRHGVLQGTTWGNMGGNPGFTRMRLGEHTTQSELTDDWTMTHELSHMAFPGLPDDQHWMEEGLATYVEPIARVQAGQLSAKRIWQDMAEGMPKGEPGEGDQGLNRTHTWGRTYWGGALFCLMADVEIRKETKSRKGLQDALRAIVAAGGNIDENWPIERAFSIGDKATGTRVLTEMYAKWGSTPVEVDLPALWKELGVRQGAAGFELDSRAPLVSVREAITTVR